MGIVKKITAGAVVVTSVMFPLLAAAQITTIASSSTLTTVDALIAWLQAILRILFIIVGILAVGVILFAAFIFLTAGDNESRRKGAGGLLVLGIIGIVIAILAFTIIPLVSSFLSL